MKIFISADIEGITGIVHDDQTGGSSNDYTRARKWMTDDVNAAIAGAIKAGAKEVYVKDAHANGRNILLEDLNKEAYLISGWDTLMSMVQGIDETFDALILIGYHSMVGTQNGILAHTYTSCIRQFSINGYPIGEAELSAITAGYYNVPTVFISGDETVIKELNSFLGEIPHAIIKYGMGKESGKIIHPEITQKSIMDGVCEAISNLGKYKPFQMELPLRMKMRLTTTKMAELISFVPYIERTDLDEVAYQAKDVISMLKMFRVMLGLAWSQR